MCSSDLRFFACRKMLMADGGVRIGLGLAAAGCLLILASQDSSPQYFAPATAAVQQQSLRGVPMTMTPEGMVYEQSPQYVVYEQSPQYYTAPQQGSDFSTGAVYALAFCAGALAAHKVVTAATQGTVVIGLAADSGCGKSTFMRRMTSIFGGEPKAPEGGNPDSNTLLSDKTTVLCLDDYHCLDRFGRKEKNVTALAPEAQNFDLMYEQVKDLKAGKSVEKPIYNHVSGLLDPPEKIESPDRKSVV